MINAFRKLALTISYVTCLPSMVKANSDDDFSGLAKFLPVVGTIIGALLVMVYIVCARLNAPELLLAFLLTLAWIKLTRGLHLDGLMDAADGLFSHRSRDEMLRIMKDSRVGNFGAISGLLVVLAKLIGLATLHPSLAISALLLIPSWARWVEAYAITCFPYAKEEGMGKIWHDTSSILDLAAAAIAPLILTIALGIYFHELAVIWISLACLIPGIIFTHRVHRTLFGQTGDTYGASVEFSESSALVLIALLQELI